MIVLMFNRIFCVLALVCLLDVDAIARQQPTSSNSILPTTVGQPIRRGDRYGEILLVRRKGLKIEAEVWGTQGLNDCPAASWNALDEERIKSQTGALAVVLNGPRYWLPDETRGKLESNSVGMFGSLQMRPLAKIRIRPSEGNSPYTERRVKRSTTFVFKQGGEIYELISPQDAVYVMQSMSQVVDGNLSISDLSKLQARLKLPNGWRYQSRILKDDLVLEVKEEAVVIQDSLRNTYQRR